MVCQVVTSISVQAWALRPLTTLIVAWLEEVIKLRICDNSPRNGGDELIVKSLCSNSVITRHYIYATRQKSYLTYSPVVPFASPGTTFAGYFYKTVVETEVVSDGVFPALLLLGALVGVVWKLSRYPAIDVA